MAAIIKTKYSRADLIYVGGDPGFEEHFCVLCWGSDADGDKIAHEDDCLLADPNVTGIWMRSCSDVCLACSTTKEECPAINGWTHRRLLIACEHYRKEVGSGI